MGCWYPWPPSLQASLSWLRSCVVLFQDFSSHSLGLVEGGVNAVSLDTCSQPPEASLCCLVSLVLLWVEKTEGDERQEDAFNFWLVLVFLLSSKSEYSCYNL